MRPDRPRAGRVVPRKAMCSPRGLARAVGIEPTPPGSKPGTRPSSNTRMAGAAGIEPATSGARTQRYCQLSYAPMVGPEGFEPPPDWLRASYASVTPRTRGGPGGDRTRSHPVNSRPLSLLSFGAMKAPGPGEPRSKDARLSQTVRPSPGGSSWNLLPRSVGARGLEPPQTGLKVRCPSSRALLPCPETSKAASVSRGGSRWHGVWSARAYPGLPS